MASSCLLEFVVRFPVDIRSVIPVLLVHSRIDFSTSPEAYDFSLYRQITKSNYRTIILARSLSRKILLSSRIVQPLVASQSRFLQKTQFSLTFLSLLVD